MDIDNYKKAFGGRLKTAQIMSGKKVMDFADSLGISSVTLKSYTSGKTVPDAIMLNNIKNTYPEINIYWLITGEGSEKSDKSMFMGSGNTNIGAFQSDNSEVTVQMDKYKDEIKNLKKELKHAEEKIRLLEKVNGMLEGK